MRTHIDAALPAQPPTRSDRLPPMGIGWTMNTMIMEFGPNPFEGTLATCGGKGLNLGLLAAAGFAVPAGFVVTTAVYQAFVEHNHIRDAIDGALAHLGADLDASALETASTTIRAAFESGEFPADLEAELAVAAAAAAHRPVAVRSSATAEDLPDLSFAGQQDTYLNVVGADQIVAAVVRCWGSLWTARAIGYRTRAGIDHDDVTLAVVVQELVPADSSGVAFTADPLTGQRDRVVIDATTGLGEALVSGQVVPDQIVCDRAGRILRRSQGSKQVATVPSAGGGVETVTRPEAGWAVDVRQVAEVVAECVRIEREFGSPQDVEWAYGDGRLWILQARPITSLYPIPDAVATDTELALFASFGSFQGMLEPLSPLGQDVLLTTGRGLYRTFGVEPPADLSYRAVKLAGERLWIRLDLALQTRLGSAILPKFLGAADPALVPLIAKLDDPRWHPSGALSLPRGLRRFLRLLLPGLVAALRDPSSARLALDRACEELVRQAAESQAGASAQTDPAQRLHARLDAMEASVEAMFPVLLTRFGPIMAPAILGMTRLQALAGPEALATLRSLEGNVTTAMDLAMWRAAVRVRADQESRGLFRSESAADLARAYLTGELPQTAADAVREFLDRYGMRAVGEIDLGKPRWRDDPTSVMASLKAYVSLDDETHAPDAEFESGKQEAKVALERLASRVKGPLARAKEAQARFIVRYVRGSFGARETPKFTIIRVFDVVRQALVESGADLVAAGRLSAADDVLFMHVRQLRAAWTTPVDELRANVAEARATYARESRRTSVPRLILGDGRTFYEGLSEGDGDLVGSAVSPGVVEGRVRVVLSPESSGLQQGEIMVCVGTDPAWTPLFLVAAGLVTEVGGLMTHGSVVAREYGLPAVVGVHAATTQLVTGQRVRLDGSAGTITFLDEEEPPGS